MPDRPVPFRAVVSLTASLALAAACGLPAASAATGSHGRRSWEHVPASFAPLHGLSRGSLREFLRDVDDAGGHVAVVYGSDAAVILGEPSVFARPSVSRWVGRPTADRVPDAEVVGLDSGGRLAARAWNAALRMARSGVAPGAVRLGRDLVTPDLVDRATSPSIDSDGPLARPFGAWENDQSLYMAGVVSAGIWLLESPDHANDWDSTEEAETIAGIQEGMAAWVRRGGAPARLTFVFDVHTGVPISGDPLLECEKSGQFIGEALATAGYTGYPSELEADRAFNRDLRIAFDADWAYSIFVVDTPADYSGHCASPGSVAWAVLGGPFVYMYRYSSWAAQAWAYQTLIPMHEVGHIFNATDEYDDVEVRAGYLNAPDLPFPFCIMNVNDSSAVCVATRAQIGWRDLDDNGVIEPLDVAPAVTAALQGANPSSTPALAYAGSATIGLVPNLNPFPKYFPAHAVSVDRIESIEARVDGGAWEPAVPSDGTFDGYTESFTWSSGDLPDGLHVVELRVPTLFGAGSEPSYRDSVWVLVNTTDRHPLVQAPADVYGAEGVEVAIDVAAWDPDGEPLDSLTADLSGIPAGATFAASGDGTSGAFRWTPGFEDAGDYAVTFAVANALRDSATTSIHVADVDRAPVILVPENVAATEAHQVSFGVSASDPDGEPLSALFADLSSLPPGNDATFALTGDGTTGTFQWTPGCADAGNHVVTFHATNALVGTAQTTIAVANDCSVSIVPIDDIVMSAGSSADASVFVIDLNGGAIEIAADLPVFATLETLAQFEGEYDGTVHLTPSVADSGDYDATISATMGGVTDLERFHVKVTPVVATGIDEVTFSSAEVTATPGRVVVRWRLDDRSILRAAIERSMDGATWSPLRSDAPVTDGSLVLEDADVLPGSRYAYRVRVDEGAARTYSRALWVDVPEAEPVPSAPRVERLAPNPTSGYASGRYAVPADGRASVAVVDVRGRLIRMLVDAPVGRGWHRFAWDGADGSGRAVSSGIYFVRLESARGRSVRKLVVLR